MAPGEWQVYVVNEVRDWIDSLDDATTPASCYLKERRDEKKQQR